MHMGGTCPAWCIRLDDLEGAVMPLRNHVLVNNGEIDDVAVDCQRLW